MHANAPDPRRQKWREKVQRSGYFLGAVLFHLILFLMLATLVIWKAPAPPSATEFQAVAVKVPPPPPAPPPTSGAAAANPQFEPQQVVVPVVTPPRVISNVDSSAFHVDTSKVIDQAMSHLSQALPQGTGLGGAGRGSSGIGGGYGDVGGGSGFVGSLYDLKQDPDQKPTDIAENAQELAGGGPLNPNWPAFPATKKGLEVLRSFVKTWDTGLLDNYYKAPVTLTATQICIPITPSENAPRAYHVEGTVHARRWNAVYHARVIAPESGDFRFIGFADDFMVVRFDGDNVLDASFKTEELDTKANVNEDVGMAFEGQPLKCGKWIHMEAGIAVDMQVLIGEGPGGFSGFLLMVQKKGDASPKGDYPVFQLQDTPIPDLDPNFHFSKKKMVFQVAP